MKFKKNDFETIDRSIYSAMISLLQIKTNEKVIFTNSNPNSPYTCRPIQLHYKKETPDLIKNVNNDIQDQLDKIESIKFDKNGRQFIFKIKVFNSMNDVKGILGQLNITNTKICFVCGQSGNVLSTMSPVSVENPPIDKLHFGMQPLHMIIKILEWLLDLAYKLASIDCLYKSEKKILFEKKRKEIHDKIYKDKGLNIDVPSIQHGRTTDGNMARLLFSDPKYLSETLQIDFDLIQIFVELAACISCAKKTSPEIYLKSAQKAFEIYSTKYYSIKTISPYLHKLLAHGHQFIENLLLPVGVLSEQSLESCNKFIKRSREVTTMKISRERILIDQFNFLTINLSLLTSEAIIILKDYEKENKKKMSNYDKYLLNE